MAKPLDWKVAVAGGVVLGVGVGGFALAETEPRPNRVDELRLRDAPSIVDASADSPMGSPTSTTVTIPARDDLQSSPDSTTTTSTEAPTTVATVPPPPPVPATDDSPEPAPAPPPPAPPPPPPPAPANDDSPASPASADSASESD
jgi:hypothetical protein